MHLSSSAQMVYNQDLSKQINSSNNVQTHTHTDKRHMHTYLLKRLYSLALLTIIVFK